MESSEERLWASRAWFGAVAVSLLVGACMGACASKGGGSGAPPGLDEDTTLLAVLIEGEKPLTSAEGIHVLAVRGSWVKLGVGKADKAGRWVNFEHVTAYSAKLTE